MGSFLFKWEHPASEVYVTGTFDGWKKTEKLEKVGNHFEKLVKLDDVSHNIDYKFVVDGEWTTDHTAPKETDASGNENNVLTTERIIKGAPATAAIMSSAAPDSTTAALAADAPIEKKQGSSEPIPGTFPETPAVDSGKKEFGVNPMPAVPGAVNPVQLAPGEKIPDHLASGSTTTNNVDLDPKAYMTPDEVAAAAFLSSATPNATTAALAAEAPLENPLEVNKVPAVVKDSQAKAHAAPEASANPAEVKDKANLEEELLEKVEPAPSTSEGTAGKGTEKTEDTVSAEEAAAAVAAAATALGGAAVAGAMAAKDVAAEKASAAATTAQTSATEAATQLPDSVKEMLPESAQAAIASKEETVPREQTIQEVSPSVPVEVKQSIAQSGESPEAAASTLAVAEKKVMETELLKEVKPTEKAAETSTAKAAEAEVSKPAQTEASVQPIVPVVEEPKEAAKPETAPVTGSALETADTEGAAAGPAAPDAPASTEADATATTNGAPTAAVIDPTTEAKPASETEPATESKPSTEAAAPAKTETTPSKTAESESANGSATDKKKKNRLSTFFQKLKPKKSS